MKINKLISILLGAVCAFSAVKMPVSCGYSMNAHADSAETLYCCDESNGQNRATTTIRPTNSTGDSSFSGAAESCMFGRVYMPANAQITENEPITTTVTVQPEAVITFTTTAEAERVPEDTTATTVTVISTEEPNATVTEMHTTTVSIDEDTTVEPTFTTTTTTTTTYTLTTTTTTPPPTITITTTTTTMQPPAPNLIMQCSISCSDKPGILLISGKTQGVQRLDEIGFRDVKILRSTDGFNWKVEKNLGNITDKNSLTCIIDKYEVEVSGGAYYSISCEHYAHDDDYEQTVYNKSINVWVDKTEPVKTTASTTKISVVTTTKKSTTQSDKQANKTDYEKSPDTGQRGVGVTVAVMLTALSAALIMRKKREE